MTDKTRRKVLKAAQELDYRPNLIARSLRMEQTFTVGLIVENILSPFIPPIIRGVQECLKRHDYLNIILDANWNPVAEAQAIERLGMRQLHPLA